MGKKWNSKLRAYEYLPDEQEAAAIRAAYAAGQESALAEPRPTNISLAHFIARNMAESVAAGLCVVTMPNPNPNAAAPLVVTSVKPAGRGLFDIETPERVWTRSFMNLNVNWERPKMTHYFDSCKCGAKKSRGATVCKACHNRRIAPLGYAAMCKKYGEKWAVRHVQRSLLANPSDLEKLVGAALDTLGVSYEREHFLKTKTSGRKARAYLVDFMVSGSAGLVAIEINGDYVHQFHSSRDKRKMSLLKRRGIPVIVLTDKDIKARRAAGRQDKAAELLALLKDKLGLDHART